MGLHALDLAEIRNLIGTHLHKTSIISCIRVNSSWHASFTPFLFHTLNLPKLHRPSTTLLQNYAHHIRHLNIRNVASKENVFQIRGCTSLTNVTLVGTANFLTAANWEQLGAFVVAHVGTIKEIQLEYHIHGESFRLWRALGSFLLLQDEEQGVSAMTRHCPGHQTFALETLAMYDHPIEPNILPEFRRLFQALNSFRLQNYAPVPNTIRDLLALDKPSTVASCTPLTLWALRRVDFHHAREDFLMVFLNHCPNLEELYTKVVVRSDAPPPGYPSHTVVMPVMNMMVQENQWPRLRILRLSGAQDSALAKFLRSTRGLTHLNAQYSQMGGRSLSVLMDMLPCSHLGKASSMMEPRTRLEVLRYLCLDLCEEVTSPTVRFFLDSCPNLESIMADKIEALDIAVSEARIAAESRQGLDGVRSYSWACTQLKVFKMNVEVAVSGDRRSGPLQRNISPTNQRLAFYRQLGRLRHLRVVHLNRNGGNLDHQAPRHGLFIQLGMGLEELAHLSELREFVFKDQRHDQGKEVAEWMVRHWPRLERIAGRLEGGRHTMLMRNIKRDTLHGGRVKGVDYKHIPPFSIEYTDPR